MDVAKIGTVREVPIDDVVPYERNPRHNDGAVSAVAESIRQFGWQQPIVVDGDNVVIVGHTRLKAARELGLDVVPVVVADRLTDDEVRAYRIADNSTGELATWDDPLLAGELADIELDMGAFGLFENENGDVEAEPVPEVEFSDQLDERQEYVIVRCTNDIDWVQMQDVLGLQEVKAWHTNAKRGTAAGKERKGIERVITWERVIKAFGGGSCRGLAFAFRHVGVQARCARWGAFMTARRCSWTRAKWKSTRERTAARGSLQCRQACRVTSRVSGIGLSRTSSTTARKRCA